RLLKENGANIWLRLPLIEGANCDEENILAARRMAEEIRPQRVSLLPYHNTGRFKYTKLNRTADEFNAPTAERLEHIKALFEEKGLDVKIGG
ncbi:MAG: glycyl-radical enzyme activating protein, partial [Clostridia bacterium]